MYLCAEGMLQCFIKGRLDRIPYGKGGHSMDDR